MRLDCARARPSAVAALRIAIFALSGVLATMLAGCSANTAVSNGTPVLTLTTQAAGDFSTYIIGVYTVSLTRTDGYVAYGQVTDEEVDLTRRVNLSELFGAMGIPTGTYTSMTIDLDYAAPIIFLKGSTKQATVEDSSGTIDPGVVAVKVTFAPNHPLVVGLNKSTPMDIAIDLAASDSINTSTNTVTVSPFVVASAVPVNTETLRARGQFVLAQPSQNNFVENIRPFDDTYYLDSDVGALTVNTTASTYFNINGKTYTGSAGLSALAAIQPQTEVTAYGTLGSLAAITPALNATQVYAGTTVISPGTEVVRGVVSARSGNTLTLQRAEFVYQENAQPASSTLLYFPTVNVTLGPSTVVSEDGVAASGLGLQSISVGQRVSVSGVATSSTSGASIVMNATNGQVRLQPTTLWGTLSSGAAGSATLDLQQIDVDAPSTFNFSGTGVTGTDDANPASYSVNTGTVDESGTTSGTLLTASGFVTPFGSAPPDFAATSIKPASAGPTSLIVEWSGGTTAPFTSSGSSGLVVNLGNSSITSATLRTGPQSVQLSSLPASPTISFGCASGSCGNAEFGIGNVKNGVSVFNSASSFLSSLSSTLNGSTGIATLVAIGTFDSTNNTFYTQRIDLVTQ